MSDSPLILKHLTHEQRTHAVYLLAAVHRTDAIIEPTRKRTKVDDCTIIGEDFGWWYTTIVAPTHKENRAADATTATADIADADAAVAHAEATSIVANDAAVASTAAAHMAAMAAAASVAADAAVAAADAVASAATAAAITAMSNATAQQAAFAIGAGATDPASITMTLPITWTDGREIRVVVSLIPTKSEPTELNPNPTLCVGGEMYVSRDMQDRVPITDFAFRGLVVEMFDAQRQQEWYDDRPSNVDTSLYLKDKSFAVKQETLPFELITFIRAAFGEQSTTPVSSPVPFSTIAE